MTVNLTGVTDVQLLTVTLTGVTDTSSQALPTTLSQHGGPAGDAIRVRSRSGLVTDATNYRFDLNVDGFVNSGDFTVVRARSSNFVRNIPFVRQEPLPGGTEPSRRGFFANLTVSEGMTPADQSW